MLLQAVTRINSVFMLICYLPQLFDLSYIGTTFKLLCYWDKFQTRNFYFILSFDVTVSTVICTPALPSVMLRYQVCDILEADGSTPLRKIHRKYWEFRQFSRRGFDVRASRRLTETRPDQPALRCCGAHPVRTSLGRGPWMLSCAAQLQKVAVPCQLYTELCQPCEDSGEGMGGVVCLSRQVEEGGVWVGGRGKGSWLNSPALSHPSSS